jgi:hypothetical protein
MALMEKRQAERPEAIRFSPETELRLRRIYGFTDAEVSRMKSAISEMRSLKKMERQDFTDNFRLGKDDRKNSLARQMLEHINGEYRSRKPPVYAWDYPVRFTAVREKHMRDMLGLDPADIINLKRALYLHTLGAPEKSEPKLSEDPQKQASMLALYRAFTHSFGREGPAGGRYFLSRASFSDFTRARGEILASMEKKGMLSTQIRITSRSGAEYIWEFPEHIPPEAAKTITDALKKNKPMQELALVFGQTETKLYSVDKNGRLFSLGNPFDPNAYNGKSWAEIIQRRGIVEAEPVLKKEEVPVKLARR